MWPYKKLNIPLMNNSLPLKKWKNLLIKLLPMLPVLPFIPILKINPSKSNTIWIVLSQIRLEMSSCTVQISNHLFLNTLKTRNSQITFHNTKVVSQPTKTPHLEPEPNQNSTKTKALPETIVKSISSKQWNQLRQCSAKTKNNQLTRNKKLQLNVVGSHKRIKLLVYRVTTQLNNSRNKVFLKMIFKLVWIWTLEFMDFNLLEYLIIISDMWEVSLCSLIQLSAIVLDLALPLHILYLINIYHTNNGADCLRKSVGGTTES